MSVDIYGIGNALVDIEVTIEDSELTKFNIQKGHMMLIDYDQVLSYKTHFKNEQFNLACGGSAANTIITAQQLGSKCFYSCKVANDDMGNFYLNDIIQNNVKTNLSNEVLENGQTGQCFIMITPDAERTMNTFLGITAQFSESNLNESALKSANYLYIEGYLVTSEPSLHAAQKAKQIANQNNVKTALTCSDPTIMTYFKTQFQTLTQTPVDILFCNEEEALTFTNETTLEAAKRKLTLTTKTYALTLGKNGSIVYDGQKETLIPPVPTKAVDTTGAGDAYAGAFLHALNEGKSYEEAGKLASRISSEVVSKFGPRL